MYDTQQGLNGFCFYLLLLAGYGLCIPSLVCFASCAIRCEIIAVVCSLLHATTAAFLRLMVGWCVYCGKILKYFGHVYFDKEGWVLSDAAAAAAYCPARRMPAHRTNKTGSKSYHA